jgi:hypothetical protein
MEHKMRAFFLMTVALLLSANFTFASLNLVLKPGFAFYSEGAGYNGTAGLKFYFNPTLAFMPKGLYIGVNGQFGNFNTTAYSYYTRGAFADIGYSISIGDTHKITPHVTVGYAFATIAGSTVTNIDLAAFSGEAALEYTAMVNEQLGVGIDIGYQFFMSSASLMNPFVNLSLDLKLF